MSRYLPPGSAEVGAAVTTVAAAAPRIWLLLGMGLAGILSVALVVTADMSVAGIDPLRAVPVTAPASEADRPATPFASVPVLGGVVAAIHDLAPVFFAPAPAPAVSPDPAPSLPAALPPARTTTPPATIAQSASPSPAPTPGPAATATPTPTASPTPPPPAPPAPPAPPLAITTDRGATAIVNLAGLLPGDTLVRTITVRNSGTLGFRYTVTAAQTASTLLWADPIDGLQLTVSTSGAAVLYSGPLSGLGSLAGPTVLAPGATELLRYTFDFPGTASNAFQGLVQDLDLVFVATQFP